MPNTEPWNIVLWLLDPVSWSQWLYPNWLPIVITVVAIGVFVARASGRLWREA